MDQLIRINNQGPYPGSIEIDQEIIEMTSLGTYRKVPKRSWSHVDSKGHFHAFDKSSENNPLPTLIRDNKRQSFWCPDCAEHHESIEISLSCRICQEVIAPEYINVPDTPKNIPGRLQVTITVFSFLPISKEESEFSFQTSTSFGIARFIGYSKISPGETTTLFQSSYLAQRYK